MMAKLAPLREMPGGGYSRPPNESILVGSKCETPGFTPSVAIDPFGCVWVHYALGWMPNGQYVPQTAKHEWGALTHER